MEVDKSLMKDSKGKHYTQGLFLEIGYGPFSQYTLKEEDHTYKGRTYPSIKKFYMQMEDPTEFEFARKYFVSWNHWKMICRNKVLAVHINEWRDELELQIQSQAIRDIIHTSSEGSYQASKYLADKGWSKNAVGRPNKADKAKKDAVDTIIENEFSSDFTRMDIVQ